VVVDIVDEGIEGTVRAVKETGNEAIGIRTDVSKLAEVRAMVDKTIKTYGQIDILWNNAAVINALYSSAEEISEEDWNKVISVNLNGVFFGVKCVIPHMKERKKGVILNTASIAGMVAHRPGRAAYVASKGAIISFTRQLSLELGPSNIRVNAIAPGSMNTGMSRKVPRPEKVTFEYERKDAAADAIRVADPMEVARTALFLVGDDIGPMTGVILPHDGGKAAR
jgi:NAD(P)-dependent dehydrogenase (short-subunit alcohol dehydrogenase family)